MSNVEDVLARLDELQAQLDLMRDLVVSPKQIKLKSGLSEIDTNAGLLSSGELRSGNGVDPGRGFSGVRIRGAVPANEYSIQGLSNDVMQFGLRASDGKAVFGGGAITADASGLQSGSYVQGYSGFKIGANGEVEFENARIRGSLRMAVFETEKVSVQSGTQWVSEGTVLLADIDADDTVIYTTESPFRTGDYVRIKAGASDEWITIDSNGEAYAEGYSYNVTRAINGDSFAFTAGQALVRMGQRSDSVVAATMFGDDASTTFGDDTSEAFTGVGETLTGGFLVLEGSRTVGPYFAVVNRYGSAYDEIAEIARMGYQYGFLGQDKVYGIAIGDSNRYFIYDPVNGLRILAGAGATIIDDDGMKVEGVLMEIQASDLDAPDAGYYSLYFKTDGKLYKRDSGGTVTEVTASVAAATTSAAGIVELATSAETITGTDTERAVTPADLRAYSDVSFGPRGFLLNGKIVPSVVSNNLTVAIKTLANADPSVTDPVYVRIGDTVRVITAALSVTVNAGTNWCNAGSAELATKEIDYFPYLVWNTSLATPAVDILCSRIPYANLFSDFSATSTNEKYALQNSTAPAATDVCENIGRFAATLSAGAGYTWTVPTFTASNLINRPIYKTRSLTWVPTYVGFSANPSQTCKYVLDMTELHTFVSTAGAGTSNATNYIMTFPFAALVQSYIITPDQVDNGVHGCGFCQLNAGSNIGTLLREALAAWTNSGKKYAELFGMYGI